MTTGGKNTPKAKGADVPDVAINEAANVQPFDWFTNMEIESRANISGDEFQQIVARTVADEEFKRVVRKAVKKGNGDRKPPLK
jgi:hypothetical protein